MLKNFIIALFLVLFIVVLRLAPHPANFAPVAAVALFSGYFFPRRLSIFIPIFGMVISDFFLGFYHWQIMLSVYVALVLPVLLGWYLRWHKNMPNVISGALFSSIVFFFITNAAVWYFSGMYEHTSFGLLQSYTLAIPFFKNTLAGDLVYTLFIFGSYEFVTRLSFMKLKVVMEDTE